MSGNSVEDIQARLEKLEAETAIRFENLEKLVQQVIKTQDDHKNFYNSTILESENHPASTLTVATTPPTPPSPLELASQSRNSRHSLAQNLNDNPPNSLRDIFDQLSRAVEVMAHSLNYMRNHLGDIQPSVPVGAQEGPGYHPSQKRKYQIIHSCEEGLARDEKKGKAKMSAFDFPSSERKDSLSAKKKARIEGTAPSTSSRYCGLCGLKGHNARTCKRDSGDIQED